MQGILKRRENEMSVFKSEEGRERIRGYYNGILNFFPPTKRFISTSFGNTFLLEAGEAENPAVILLHGSCSNSAAWLGDIPALAAKYHVFAVDILGEPGNSDESRLALDTDEYPRWLGEVLDGLGADKAVVVGNSMGGWLALHFASEFPERTMALVLMAPSGIIPPRQHFLDLTKDIDGDPSKAASVGAAVMGDAQAPKEVLEFMALVMENFNPITGVMPVLIDKQLHALTMPVLLIVGTEDVTLDAENAAQRLLRFVPHAKVHLIKGAHVIMSAADMVMPFLAKEL
jgi:pimeloyl-ACP methyl ester carboxylesterase